MLLHVSFVVSLAIYDEILLLEKAGTWDFRPIDRV